ncbi:MAG: hypothetical protein WAQ52_15170 [Terriglobales bacterium]
MNVESRWTVYHTRFLVRARQLTEPLVFTDVFGREQSGHPGDYLVESSEGFRRITPRQLFEDIYVPVHPSPSGTSHARGSPQGRAPGVLAPQSSPSRIPVPAWSG